MHEGLLEEQQRREEVRRRIAEEREEERRRMVEEEEERTREREYGRERERRKWREKERAEREAWRRYIAGWEELGRWRNERRSNGRDSDAGGEESTEGRNTTAAGNRARLPWPTKSGKARDVVREEVEAFFRACPTTIATLGMQTTPPVLARPRERQLSALLKAERVRWHPDKMAQHYGELMSERELGTVTAVFQIVDRMWNELRDS